MIELALADLRGRGLRPRCRQRRTKRESPDLRTTIYWREDMTTGGWVALALVLVVVAVILTGLLSRRISAAVVAVVVFLVTLAALIALK
jgi:hypothetical protein